MQEIFITPEINVAVRISSRAKRIQIFIDSSQRPWLVVPRGISIDKAKKFLDEHKAWVMAHVANPKLKDESEITILGKSYQIMHSLDRVTQIRIEGEQLILPQKGMPYKMRLQQFLDEILFKEVLDYIDDTWRLVGKRPNKVTLRSSNSRWGSCSSEGNIMISRKLVFSPLHVVQYVVLHELCHLIEHNHSKRFWDLVQSIRPDYKLAEKWLKLNGRGMDVL